MAEAGLPGCEATSWYGILGPAGLPREITLKLNGELGHIMNSADIKERFATLGTEPVTGTPEAFAQFIQAEVKKWSAVSKAAGVELE
jgi:tripartite-type tricarboxylate transporter receptor subunit TctC